MLTGHGDDLYLYNHVRLNFSSNIPAHADIEELKAFLRQQFDAVSCYPEPEPFSAEHAIARQRGVPAECVLMTNGATEAIYLVAQLLRSEHFDFCEIAQPTFSEYRDACMMAGLPCGDSRADGGKCAFWLCNPNNPSGDVYDQSVIDRMMVKYDLLVVDQSYEYYTDQFVMKPRWAAQTPYMIQIHLLTKTYGGTGLRLVYITAHESLTRHIRRFVRPWNVSALSVEAGKFLLAHEELRCEPDLNEAQRLRDHLEQLEGVITHETATNFMLCRLERGTAAELKDYLACEHGLLIRDASNFRGLTPQHFRVAAQSPKENDALVSAIEKYLQQCPT